MTFTNAVNTGQFIVCKVSAEPSLQLQVFHFTSTYTVNGNTITTTADLTPGACSFYSDNIPVVDPNGNPIQITTTEALTPTVAVSDITATGSATIVSSDTTAQTATYTVGAGIGQINFTNVRTAPGM